MRRSLTLRHAALALVLCAFALLIGPARAPAEEAAQHDGSTHAAPAAKAADSPAAAGCPYAEGGACCGECREKAAQGQPQNQAEMDCPCKRAKKAREGA